METEPLFYSGEIAHTKIGEMSVCIIKQIKDCKDGLTRYKCGFHDKDGYYCWGRFYEVELKKIPSAVTYFFKNQL